MGERRNVHRLAAWWTLLFALIGTVLFASTPSKRVAVLYFDDKSGFDAPSGCGCLPLGPLDFLFGRTKRQREYWNLEVGFRDMLLTTLRDAPGYEPVMPDEVMTAYAELGIDQKSLKNPEVRAKLAEKLNADILVIGKIRKFKQERAQGLYRRDVSGRATAGVGTVTGGTGSIGVMGSYYDARISVDFVAYARTGAEVLATEVAASNSYQGGAVRSGPLQARIDGEGAQMYLGAEQIIRRRTKPPVVRHEVLDQIKFGVPGWDDTPKEGDFPNYRETLLGRTTQEVMDEFVEKLRERVGPPLEDLEEEERPLAVGNIPFVLEETGDIFVNLGTAAKLRPGDRLRVFREVEVIRDLDTGEKLGAIEKEVGLLEVVEVVRPKLSKTRLLSGEARKGDIVKTIVESETVPASPETPSEEPKTDEGEGE